MDMYCTKCGKKANPGDRFCGGCGAKLGTVGETAKNPGGLGIMAVLILVILVIGGLWISRMKAEQEQLREQIRWGEVATEMAAEPNPVKTYYSDGALHTATYFHSNGLPRYVEERDGDGNVIQAENYWENGNIQTLTMYSYNAGAVSELTVYTCDEYGNTISFSQQYADGKTFNSYYYSYDYDDQGRMVAMTNFNQNGVLIQEETRSYHADGSYTRDYTEYRGANTYDWEFEMGDPDVANKWYHAIMECDAQGNVLWEECDFSDGYDVR